MQVFETFVWSFLFFLFVTRHCSVTNYKTQQILEIPPASGQLRGIYVCEFTVPDSIELQNKHRIVHHLALLPSLGLNTSNGTAEAK